jgi:hypothetical protein
MVLPQRGLTHRRKGRFQGEVPLLGKECLGDTSLNALFERGQPALRPHRGFGPGPAAPGVSVLCSRGRHWRRSWFPWRQRRTSISLHPFAPPALPGFHATRGALTPAWRLVAALSTQVSLCHVPYRPTLPSPTTPRRPVVSGLVLSHRLTGGRPGGRRLIPLGNQSVIWVSPFPSRLTTTTGRIAFVILRTSRSPPVALHLPSRERSYLQLRSSDRTSARTCTSQIQDTYKRTRTALLSRRDGSGEPSYLTYFLAGGI